MLATMQFTGTLVVLNCCECGMSFGMTAEFNRDRHNDGALFYCPAGHKQHYTTSEVDRLQRQLDRAETRARAARDQADAAERSRRAYKGQVTKIRNRTSAGVCPVDGCRRHFANVGRHMASQHPGYADHDRGEV
jgi:hypothetical protein